MALAKDSKANYIPLATIYGNRNKDGSYTLSALDIKNLNDNLYAIAKKIQGGLTFSDLTSEAGSEISDMSGNVSTLQQTSEAITAEVTSLAARNTVTINANGMFVTNAAGQTTQLSGDHIKSGTIEGVTLISDNGEAATTIGNGEISIKPSGAYFHYAKIYYDASENKVIIDGLYNPLKIRSQDNLSIGSTGGTVYVGSDAAGPGNVYIGKANGGRIDIWGDLYINGVAYGS